MPDHAKSKLTRDFGMNIKAFIAVCLFGLGVMLAGSATLRYHKKDHPPFFLTARDIRRIRGQIIRVMNRRGPAAAHAFAKTLYTRQPEASQGHLLMHVFAEVAYARYGPSGMDYCDDTYEYGCMHGFFSQIVTRRGLDAARDFFPVCRKRQNPVGCEHGIGHVIMEYFGSDRIVEALDTCEALGALEAPSGCMGGAYMEYQFPRIYSGGFVVARPFNPDNPYDPCPGLAPHHRASCYFRIVGWWDQVLGGNNAKMGELCTGIPQQEFRKPCFIGIGAIRALTSQFDKNEVTLACREATQNGEYQMTCLSGLTWVGEHVAERLRAY